jgi:RNA polymerase sigma-70 factor (ECF subfamily)
MAHDVQASSPRPSSGFDLTRWSLVLSARDGAQAALETLCRGYWYPVYAYMRRHCDGAAEAEDLTQEFFARLLEKDFLETVDPQKGLFRAFLLACCKHFLANEREKARTKKRGAGRPVLSLDFASAAGRYCLEPADTLTAEKLFERRWALTLLDQTLEQLETEYRTKDPQVLYRRLHSALVCKPDTPAYREIAAELGLSEAAVNKAAQRMRRRYKEIMSERIATTVNTPEEIEAEIRWLFEVLSF